MPRYLLEYSDVYLKTSGSFWQYHRDESALDNNNNITDFPRDNNNSISFKFKLQITGHTRNGDTKNVEIMVPLKYLSHFCKIREIPLMNCEISIWLKWSANCILIAGTAANQVVKFRITDTKLYVPVVTLWTQDKKK